MPLCDCGSCGQVCCPHETNCASQQDRRARPADPSDDYTH